MITQLGKRATVVVAASQVSPLSKWTFCRTANEDCLFILSDPVCTILEPVQVLVSTQAAMSQVRDGSAAGIAKELGAIHCYITLLKHVYPLF